MTWRRCRVPTWPRGSGRRAWSGSAWRAVTIATARAVRARGAFRAGARSRVAHRGTRAVVVRSRPAAGTVAHHLERRDRGAAVLHVRLHLVTRAVHERSLQLPVPMRDARTLRTLLLLDLESHPPSAAIDRVVVAVDPTPGRVVQYSLLTRPLPTPEQLSTLMARLQALMGESRCGAGAWSIPGGRAHLPCSRLPPRDTCQTHGRLGTRSRGFSACYFKERRTWRSEAATCRGLRRFASPAGERTGGSRAPVRVIADRRGMSVAASSAVPGRGGRPGDGGLRQMTKREARRCGGARVRPTGDRRAESLGTWDRDEWDVTLTDGARIGFFASANPSSGSSMG